MITISLCMIVKNEEQTLPRCLTSVSEIADEIIIADTGSTDGTKTAAGSFTDKIFDYPWNDNFSAARNFSFDKASMDYILWLDADDIILPQDRDKFKELKENLEPDTDAVMMKYNTAYDESGRPLFSYYRERLVKRENHFRWKEPVHEYLEVGGKILNSDIGISHAKPAEHAGGTRNLDIYENILRKGKTLSLRGRYYYARELKDHGFFSRAIPFFEDFISDEHAWSEDRINACLELSKCYSETENKTKSLETLMRSFAFDLPRAETCCQIGYFYKDAGSYQNAVFWFELAQHLEIPSGTWGFIRPDCWGYIPCLECVVCYDKLGETRKAEMYNSRASLYKPESKAVEYNRKYFEYLKRKS